MDNQDKVIQYRLTAYLIKSIKNYKTKYIRKKELQQNIETLFGEFTELEKDIPMADNTFSQEIQNMALENALKNLKDRDRQILLMHLLDEYSFKEISDILKLHYKTVYNAYSRILKKIKEEVSDEDEF